jgi:L-amino acid N-acyltransferase YncA
MMLQDPTAAVTFQDKTGCAFLVRPLEVSDRRALEHFYAQFEPKRAAQGLPPADIESIHRWLKKLLRTGHHLVVQIDGRLMGHLMLIPKVDEPGALELANFIHQTIRNRGIGTQLNRMGIEIARAAGATRIWLSVEPSNRVAIRSYTKAGFRTIPGSLWAPEIEMDVPLKPEMQVPA